MKKVSKLLAALTIFGLMTGCGGFGGSNTNTGASDETQNLANAPEGITITLKVRDKLKLYLCGTGAATIDWGDNSPADSIMLTPFSLYSWGPYDFEHQYPDVSEYIVRITGDDITGLTCANRNVKNLILNLTTLTTLDCSANQLTTLNVSKNTNLTELYCQYNQITTLDVSKNTDMRKLSCNDNHLTTLDVSKNTAMEILYCGNSELTTLDVSKNTAMEILHCENSELTTLDVSENTNLKELYCGNNQLTSLDVSENTALTNLSCRNNQLTTLDVSTNTAIKYLYCEENQLTTLDVSKNTALESLYCNDNQLSAEALNALFRSLCNNKETKRIRIGNNTGTDACDRNIAEKKKWNIIE